VLERDFDAFVARDHSSPTLNRFYSLHYALPFILAGLSIFHIAALHHYGSKQLQQQLYQKVTADAAVPL
jgi:quinol-cytochrome oxidoreductase complex cytochrome b subunit